MSQKKTRLAIVVSHPVQYYAPLYERLALREDIEIKVFFTWHAGQGPQRDHGFMQDVAWDIPLTRGYEWELVANVSGEPGTHRFFGLRNPALAARVIDWAPDAVHLTGWAWHSHLLALKAFRAAGVPVLFRGDSHLLDSARRGPAWWLKRAVLKRVFSWPAAFLFVGAANREYYEAFGVEPGRLHRCPHSIDAGRFSEPHETLELEALAARRELGIPDGQVVFLFAGKFERRKRPLELMRAAQALPEGAAMLLLAGSGELEPEVRALAAAEPSRFRVLPFQNQTRMPVAYRMGDVFVLPSSHGETWGLAVNEALACGRPVLVSDRVGCAADVVNDSCGRVFRSTDFSAMIAAMKAMSSDRKQLLEMRAGASLQARAFDIACTEDALVACLRKVVG